MGQSSHGRSNTSRPLTQSAYQLVGGHAPSSKFAFSYSYTESSETSCRGNPDAAADNSWAVNGCVALLSEFACSLVGRITRLREKRVEHQMTAGDEVLGGEFEHGAQLLRRPEIGHHLGEQNQPIIALQIIVGGEDVTLDHAHVERSLWASSRISSANFGVISTTSTGWPRRARARVLRPVPPPMSSTRCVVGSHRRIDRAKRWVIHWRKR
jgi:hypothetical protein